MTSSKMSSDSSTECSEVVLESEVNLATFAGGKRVGSLSEVDDLRFDPYGNQHNNKTVLKRSSQVCKCKMGHIFHNNNVHTDTHVWILTENLILITARAWD